MECVYRVSEYGRSGVIESYLERDRYRPFFANEIAHIRYSVSEVNNMYLLDYEVLTDEGEQVAYSRWHSKAKNKPLAEIEAIEKAMKAVHYCASVPCVIGYESADDVIGRLQKECERINERESQESVNK